MLDGAGVGRVRLTSAALVTPALPVGPGDRRQRPETLAPRQLELGPNDVLVARPSPLHDRASVAEELVEGRFVPSDGGFEGFDLLVEARAEGLELLALSLRERFELATLLIAQDVDAGLVQSRHVVAEAVLGVQLADVALGDASRERAVALVLARGGVGIGVCVCDCDCVCAGIGAGVGQVEVVFHVPEPDDAGSFLLLQLLLQLHLPHQMPILHGRGGPDVLSRPCEPSSRPRNVGKTDLGLQAPLELAVSVRHVHPRLAVPRPHGPLLLLLEQQESALFLELPCSDRAQLWVAQTLCLRQRGLDVMRKINGAR